MSGNLSKAYLSSGAHRYHSRRRALKKISLLSLIVGLLSIVLSAVFFASSLLNRAATQHKMLLLSVAYVGIGVALLAVRFILEIYQNRKSKPKRWQPEYRAFANGTNGKPENAPVAPHGTPANDSRKGSVLIMVLAVLALIAGLVIEAQLSARSILRRERSAMLKLQLRSAATDAARYALQILANDDNLSLDSTNDAWAAAREIRNPIGITTSVRITDENRYFDLNNLGVAATNAPPRLPSDITMDLFTACGDFAPLGRVQALTDWIDSDDEGFAESAYYQQLKPPYLAANRILYSWSEMLDIKDFSRKLFARHEHNEITDLYNADLMDCVTVLPFPRTRPVPININTAGKDALLGVLGLDHEDLVRIILVQRLNTPIRSIEPLLLAINPNLLQTVQPYLDVKSSCFTVDAISSTDEQSLSLRVLARRSPNGSVEVLQWVL